MIASTSNKNLSHYIITKYQIMNLMSPGIIGLLNLEMLVGSILACWYSLDAIEDLLDVSGPPPPISDTFS